MIILWLIIMTMFGSIASIFLKKAAGKENVRDILLCGNLYLGGGMYLIASLLNIVILHYLDYSVVLPMTSLTYIWTIFFARLLLKEALSVRKIIGAMVIVVGAIIISV